MDQSKIENRETLYRVVRHSCPDAFIDGKPSAALFMDPKGVSVDRDGERDEKTIVEMLKKRFDRRQDYKTSVSVSALQCREAGTSPKPKRTKSNKFHAEIHESDTAVPISLLKAVALASQCKEVSV